jgi:hypothetical protein
MEERHDSTLKNATCWFILKQKKNCNKLDTSIFVRDLHKKPILNWKVEEDWLLMISTYLNGFGSLIELQNNSDNQFENEPSFNDGW